MKKKGINDSKTTEEKRCRTEHMKNIHIFRQINQSNEIKCGSECIIDVLEYDSTDFF